MDLEATLTVVVGALALLPIVIAVWRGGPPTLRIPVAALWAGLSVVAWLHLSWSRPPIGEDTVTDRPIEVERDDYVQSDACRACHPHEYATWHSSYHRSMTQVASPTAVVGSFDVELQRFETRWALHHEDDTLFATRTTTDGGTMTRPIVMTTGSHHMQVYWMPTGNDRVLEPLPYVWMIADQRWIPADSSFLKPPVDHQNDETGRWNQDCIRCHATHGVPGISDDGVDTQAAELGISCEACHGPGAEHVAKYRDPLARYAQHRRWKKDPTIVKPDSLNAQLGTQVCGNCHGMAIFPDRPAMERWMTQGYQYRPGQELEPVRHLLRRRESDPVVQELLETKPYALDDRFWPDGEIRVSGREYNGLIRTGCHAEGALACTSCHLLHRPPDDPRPMEEWLDDQLKVEGDSDASCSGDGCHDDLIAAGAEHHHHQPGSLGAQCTNCHMPHTTYGLLKAMRTHEIGSPDVATTLETGRPNACNLCHLDQTIAWTAEHLGEWTGKEQPALSPRESSTSAGLIWLLEGDAGQRALMAWHLGWEDAQATAGTEWMAPYLGHLLLDPYDANRWIAARSLRTLPGFADFEYDFLAPLPDRAAATQAVFARWSEQQAARPDSERASDPKLLLNPDGTLRADEVAELAALRDDGRINLLE